MTKKINFVRAWSVPIKEYYYQIVDRWQIETEIGGGRMANDGNEGDTPHSKEKSSFYTNFNMYLILLENFTDFFFFPIWLRSRNRTTTPHPVFIHPFIHSPDVCLEQTLVGVPVLVQAAGMVSVEEPGT